MASTSPVGSIALGSLLDELLAYPVPEGGRRAAPPPRGLAFS
jgi:hypothetical protein